MKLYPKLQQNIHESQMCRTPKSRREKNFKNDDDIIFWLWNSFFSVRMGTAFGKLVQRCGHLLNATIRHG
jgi:hypothetical protein